jgi:hypothetical protein
MASNATAPKGSFIGSIAVSNSPTRNEFPYPNTVAPPSESAWALALVLGHILECVSRWALALPAFVFFKRAELCNGNLMTAGIDRDR